MTGYFDTINLAETDFIKKNCCISNNIKLAITLKLQKNIAQDFNISVNTVNRIINSFLKNIYQIKNIFLKFCALMSLKLQKIVREQ